MKVRPVSTFAALPMLLGPSAAFQGPAPSRIGPNTFACRTVARRWGRCHVDFACLRPRIPQFRDTSRGHDILSFQETRSDGLRASVHSSSNFPDLKPLKDLLPLDKEAPPPYTESAPPLLQDTRIGKLFNFVLLASSFGFALYTILNIDHGMTRGWTQSEIAMRIPVDNWSGYENSLQEKPVITKTMINVIIYLLGDWLSQTLFQKKNVLDFDAFRTIRNGFIGLCFGPLVHEYYEWSDQILPVDVGVNRVYKILMDQTLYLSVKCSIYIMAVGLLSGEKFDDVAENVKERIGDVIITAWKFWPLVHCITYGAIPARHRILWVNSVDLIWNAILAAKASGDEVEEDEDVLEGSADAPVVEAVPVNRVEVDDASVLAAMGLEKNNLLKEMKNGGEGYDAASELLAMIDDNPVQIISGEEALSIRNGTNTVVASEV